MQQRFQILEALYIKNNESDLNIQAQDLQALPSMRRQSIPSDDDQSQMRTTQPAGGATP